MESNYTDTELSMDWFQVFSGNLGSPQICAEVPIWETDCVFLWFMVNPLVNVYITMDNHHFFYG